MELTKHDVYLPLGDWEKRLLEVNVLSEVIKVTSSLQTPWYCSVSV
jgi:hypothetical protein